MGEWNDIQNIIMYRNIDSNLGELLLFDVNLIKVNDLNNINSGENNGGTENNGYSAEKPREKEDIQLYLIIIISFMISYSGR